MYSFYSERIFLFNITKWSILMQYWNSNSLINLTGTHSSFKNITTVNSEAVFKWWKNHQNSIGIAYVLCVLLMVFCVLYRSLLNPFQENQTGSVKYEHRVWSHIGLLRNHDRHIVWHAFQEKTDLKSYLFYCHEARQLLWAESTVFEDLVDKFEGNETQLQLVRAKISCQSWQRPEVDNKKKSWEKLDFDDFCVFNNPNFRYLRIFFFFCEKKNE